MGVIVWAAVAAQAFQPAGAVLRTQDRTVLDARALAVSADGGRVLVWGERGATLLGAEGSVGPSVDFARITSGAVATTGQFALAHEGGVTVHGEGGKEQVRLAAFGRVNGVTISPDGRQLAIATSLALTVNDATDGKTLWASDGEALQVAYDINGALWAKRGEQVIGYQGKTGKVMGPGAMPASPRTEDGCVAASEGPLCPHPGAIGAIFDGHMLLLAEGAVEVWRLIDAAAVKRFASEGSPIAELSWLPGGDLLVVRESGAIERRGPEGSVIAQVTVTDCPSPCALLGAGEAPDGGFWAASRAGSVSEWDGLGTLRGKPAKTKVKALDRAPDGRWVSLDKLGRVRVGKKPGKGALLDTVELGEDEVPGVDIAGESVAAWTRSGLVLIGTDGERKAPAIGTRLPAAVTLSRDGAYAAMIDDGGALHLYRSADGGTVFRTSAGLSGNLLAFDAAGSTIYAGGAPLRAFGLGGAEVGRVVFAPSGELRTLAVSPEGAWALDERSKEAGVLLRIDVPGALPEQGAPGAP